MTSFNDGIEAAAQAAYQWLDDESADELREHIQALKRPEPPTVVAEYGALTVDRDVREAWADSIFLGSRHETVMPMRRAIEDGEYDSYPALQAMQLLKNRVCGNRPETMPWPVINALEAAGAEIPPKVQPSDEEKVERVAKAMANAHHRGDVWNDHNMSSAGYEQWREMARAALAAAGGE